MGAYDRGALPSVVPVPPGHEGRSIFIADPERCRQEIGTQRAALGLAVVLAIASHYVQAVMLPNIVLEHFGAPPTVATF